MRAFLDDVVHQPVLHFGRPRFTQHAVQLGPPKGLGTADQKCQQFGSGVARVPELPREILLGLQPLRDGTQFAEVYPVVITVFFIHFASPGFFQCGQFRHKPGHSGLEQRFVRRRC
ncbi:hypothetical protein D3C73_1289490 [compost metagenome]